jgi:ribonuclease Z
MQIISLGTSSGTPTKARNVSATALKMAGAKSWVLVDCGEGTQQQLLQTPLSLGRLDCILITHVHGDHTFGLPGLLASASLSGRKKPLRIIGPAVLESWLKNCQDMSETYLSYDIDFIDVATVKKTLVLKHFNVDIHPLSHRVPSYAYSFTEALVEQKIDTQKLTADGIPAGPV